MQAISFLNADCDTNCYNKFLCDLCDLSFFKYICTLTWNTHESIIHFSLRLLASWKSGGNDWKKTVDKKEILLRLSS